MPTVQIIIKGKVQGVFYRASAKEKAKDLGLNGWIRNTPEGNVLVMVSGEPGLISDFIKWCRKGPSGAIVTHVHTEEKQEQNFDGFIIQKH